MSAERDRAVKHLVLKDAESCKVVTGNTIKINLNLGWQVIIGMVVAAVLILATVLVIECLSRDDLPPMVKVRLNDVRAVFEAGSLEFGAESIN